MKTSWWYDLYFVDPQLWFVITMFLIALAFVGLCLLEKAWEWADKRGHLEPIKAWAKRTWNGRRMNSVRAFFKDAE